ncbi:MAG: diacylglycerol kinase [Clostridium sp.]
MKIRKLVQSFNHAIDGIIETTRTQRNMKIHLIVAIIVLVSCLFFDISKSEFLIIAISVTLVIAFELINTAIEAVIDMTTNYYHPLAKVAKNAAAGGVLITAISACIIGYIVFGEKLYSVSYSLIHTVKSSEPYMIFIALVIVTIATVIVKSIIGEGTPLKGGMPSGHATLSFSIATAIALITEDPLCILLSYLAALITAQSRVDSKVHSIFEVIVGALFGTLLTLLIFTIFRL